MGGVVFCMGECFVCHQPFGFNPLRVPSYKGEPICKTCIEAVNGERRRRGMPEWPVASDAYEPVAEEELP